MDRDKLKTTQRGDSNSTEAVKALKAVHELLNKFFSKSSLCEPQQDPSTTECNTNTITPSSLAAQLLPTQPKIITTNGTNDDKSNLAHQSKQEVNGSAVDPKIDGSGSLPGTRANQTVATTTNGAEGAQVPEPEQPDHQATKTAASEASKTGAVNGTNGTNSLGTTDNPGTNRLRALADEISRNIDALAPTGPGSPGDPSEALVRVKLTSAATELLGAVRPPPDSIMGWFAQMSIVSVVRVFQHWGVFEAIPAEKGASIAASELAKKVGAEESLLVRMSWMLTSSNVLQYIPPTSTSTTPRLSHTPTSLLLREDSPMSSMFKLMYTNVVETSTILPLYFDTYDRKEPLGAGHIPTSFLAGQPSLEYFELLNQNPDKVKDFMHAMSIAHRRSPITGMYDLSWIIQQGAILEDQKNERPIWVDIGGSNGSVIKTFREANPDLKSEWCVVQDLPEVAKEAEEAAVGDEKLKGVKWVPLDFHREVPVKGALVYYLRHIVRDYSDPVVVNILSNIRQSMIPPSTDPQQAASRILISEQLFPSPPPLFAAFKDYAMLAVGGKERSLENFEAVAEAAGLEVTGVYRDIGTPHAVVEMQIKV